MGNWSRVTVAGQGYGLPRGIIGHSTSLNERVADREGENDVQSGVWISSAKKRTEWNSDVVTKGDRKYGVLYAGEYDATEISDSGENLS